jgi:hypothetical protein
VTRDVSVLGITLFLAVWVASRILVEVLWHGTKQIQTMRWRRPKLPRAAARRKGGR